MFIRTVFVVALLTLGLQTANAQSTSSITSTSTGTFSNAISFPGVIDIPAGASYELVLTTEFDPEAVSFLFPYTSISGPAPVSVTLKINANTYSFSGEGATFIGLHQYTHAGQPYNAFMHGINFYLAGTDDHVFLSHTMSAVPADLPGSTVFDLFEIGSGSYTSVDHMNTSISLRDEGTINDSIIRTNSYPARLSFTTTGTVIATPVPEPSSYAMLAAGLFMLAVVRRRTSGLKAVA